MARIYPLFSSSKGNSFFFGTPAEGILIDCGVSCKRLCDALTANEIPLAAVKGVFITHTHSDHISGLKNFLKKTNAPLFAQQKNIDILLYKGAVGGERAYPVDSGGTNGVRAVTIGGCTVEYFPTPHDTEASCGYRVRFADGKTAALCTDLGCVTESVWNGIRGAELVVLESNYDADMLRSGSYPFELKRRIASERGHLSNLDCGRTMKRLAESGTRSFVLAHISPENNTPALAVRAAAEAMSPLVNMRDYLLYAAPMEGGGAIAF
ncbi:MAG: MBL fold metallo-hydrolase [Ruminococcus sp.]|nr:MBL fold metallo-hydrolase [Ruminococcus sp.]